MISLTPSQQERKVVYIKDVQHHRQVKSVIQQYTPSELDVK